MESSQSNSKKSVGDPFSDIQYKQMAPTQVVNSLGNIKHNDDPLDDTTLHVLDTSTQEEPQTKPKSSLMYAIDDVPPWYLTIMLGLQHYLTMLGATISIPLILSDSLCIGDDYVALSGLLCTAFFVSGVSTLIQSVVGIRLPIVQGGSFSFLAAIFAMLSLDEFRCDNPDNPTDWKFRIREIQGALMVASVVEISVGFSGIVGLTVRFITPLVIAPTITLIGLSLFRSSAAFAGVHWGISSLTMFLVILFSQYLKEIKLPFPAYSKATSCYAKKLPVFKLFPVILAIFISWLLSFVLTKYDLLEGNARTDAKSSVLIDAKWIYLPYPGQWGLPTVGLASVLGMVSGFFASMIESIGDYYAAARLSGAPPPPRHAVNRGIMLEGATSLLAGAFGCCTGTTSFSENIGAIGITQVGSRVCVQAGAAVMVLFGLLGKFGAIFVTIPDPIIGGIFCIVFGMIIAIGVSNLQYVDMNSPRNLSIFGFSVLMGLVVPYWFGQEENKGVINTTVKDLDSIILILLKTGMFVGGLLAFILDNTIPGTAEERGLVKWNDLVKSSDENDKTYDLPFGIGKRLHFLPICPSKHRISKSDDTEMQTQEVESPLRQ